MAKVQSTAAVSKLRRVMASATSLKVRLREISERLRLKLRGRLWTVIG
jgi:hypothetical protein